MNQAKFRYYQPYLDTPKVASFLEQTYPGRDRHPNWLRSRWEYMVYSGHDGKEEELTPIGLWEADGEIVGMVNFEAGPGEAYFALHPEHRDLKQDMLDHAELALYAERDGKRSLTLFINDFDHELEHIAKGAGYTMQVAMPQVTARYDLTGDVPETRLPPGFRLTDRSEKNDLVKINRVLWRGFDHDGPSPDKYVAGRADVERAPLYRADLVVMAEAPDGNFASYCGVWYEPVNRVAYVEPVATDPGFRRQGLGMAVVLEALRRAQALGARRGYVFSGLAFYKAIGFEPVFCHYPWVKAW